MPSTPSNDIRDTITDYSASRAALGRAEAACSLSEAIHHYRQDWAAYLAACDQATADGGSDDLPRTYEPAAAAIAAWSRPAETLAEAKAALDLAIDDYEVGRTPRIPAMLGAIRSWMVKQEERCTRTADAIAALPDHASLRLAQTAILTLVEVTSNLVSHPAMNSRAGSYAGDLVDAINLDLIGQAEAILARAASLPPLDASGRANQARIEIAHALAFPADDQTETIALAAAALAEASGGLPS